MCHYNKKNFSIPSIFSLNHLKRLRLITALKRTGRNVSGRITIRRRGGGRKRFCYLIDFNRSLVALPARVCRIVKDPNRTAFLALICFSNGALVYIIAPVGLVEGNYIVSVKQMLSHKQQLLIDSKKMFNLGVAAPLFTFIPGSVLYNIAITDAGRGQFVRSAGVQAKLLRLVSLSNYVLIRLPSLQEIVLNSRCFAVSGRCSNVEHKLQYMRRAGDRRILGWRPSVRGVAMNPIDHPHGGGEGKTSGGRCSSTPWGRPTKGFLTANSFKKRRRKFLRLLVNKL
jgi:large subunit ribosomal protein L2